MKYNDPKLHDFYFMSEIFITTFIFAFESTKLFNSSSVTLSGLLRSSNGE